MKKQIIISALLVGTMTTAGYALGTFVLEPSLQKQNESNLINEHDKTAQKLKNEKKEESIVVKLGKVMVPLYRSDIITYVIADLGVSIRGEKKADFYKDGNNKELVKSKILENMLSLSDTGVFSGPTVDTEYVSQRVRDELKEGFPEIDELLFLDLIKQDVVRG